VKTVRIAVSVLLLMAVLALSGCTKTYFFSFKNLQSLVDYQGAWTLEEDDEWGFTPRGFQSGDANVACPFRFSGDFTYTVKFYLKADATHLIDFGICLGDGTWYDTTENDLHIEFYNTNSATSYYYIYDHDQDGTDFEHYDIDEDAPGLVTNGLNTFKLVKTGNNIRITFNEEDEPFADFDLVEYNSIWFGPNVWMEQNFPLEEDFGFFLESVEVVYTAGQRSDMPLGDE